MTCTMQQAFLFYCSLIVLSTLCGCTGKEGLASQSVGSRIVADLSYSESPISVPAGTLYAEHVSCGPDPMNAFDIYLPNSDTKTPLIVYVHGGGFMIGDKSNIIPYADDINAMLNAGVAFASINYRLLDSIDDTGVRKPLGDSRYCLQFMRHHHDIFNIDKDRVAAFGRSAGAGTALWLGSHDDMKNITAEDPVEHESTRLRAVAIFETQATYDILRWREVFENETIEALEQRLLSFYGISDMAQLRDPAIVAYRADVDMLASMDMDDAPVWIESTDVEEVEPDDNLWILFHHPYHAQAVMNQAESVGLAHFANIPELGIQAENGTHWVDFLLGHLE